MALVRRSVLKLHKDCKSLALISYVLCLILVLRGIFYTRSIPIYMLTQSRGIDLFIHRIVLWGIQFHGTPALLQN